MTIPSGRILKFDQSAIGLLNALLDHLRSGAANGDVAPDAKIAAGKLRGHTSADVIVGTTQKTVPHQLGVVPTRVDITMKTAGNVYYVRVDDKFVYVVADAADRKCDIHVMG